MFVRSDQESQQQQQQQDNNNKDNNKTTTNYNNNNSNKIVQITSILVWASRMFSLSAWWPGVTLWGAAISKTTKDGGGVSAAKGMCAWGRTGGRVDFGREVWG